MSSGRRRRSAHAGTALLRLQRAPLVPDVFRDEQWSGRTTSRVIVCAALVVTTFTLRPNVLGENFNVVGVGALLLAALLALAVGRGDTPVARGGPLILLFVAAAETWAVYRSPTTGDFSADSTRSAVFTVVVVLAGIFLLGSQWTARWLLRFVVVVVIVLSASQLVTSLALVAGAPVGAYLSFPVGAYTALVHPPFSVDVGQILIGGVNVERFAGLGREPGWMSMWAAFAWFVWPLVGTPSWWGRAVLASGVLTPISTAGFGIFVIVLAASALVAPKRDHGAVFLTVRTGGAAALLLVAAWAALYAPVFGLTAKSTLTATSLEERSLATDAGLDAISRLSLGDVGAPSSINLIAAVASHGWPFSVLILLALLAPLLVARDPLRIAPPLLVIVLTLVIAQPIDGSPFPWLVILAMTGLQPSRPRRSRAGKSASREVDLTWRTPTVTDAAHLRG